VQTFQDLDGTRPEACELWTDSTLGINGFWLGVRNQTLGGASISKDFKNHIAVLADSSLGIPDEIGIGTDLVHCSRQYEDVIASSQLFGKTKVRGLDNLLRRERGFLFGINA
jgi:hypothetical protein